MRRSGLLIAWALTVGCTPPPPQAPPPPELAPCEEAPIDDAALVAALADVVTRCSALIPFVVDAEPVFAAAFPPTDVRDDLQRLFDGLLANPRLCASNAAAQECAADAERPCDELLVDVARYGGGTLVTWPDEFIPDSACVSIFKGRVPAGGTCAEQRECASGSLCADAPCGVCVAYAQPGEPCRNDCGPGWSCVGFEEPRCVAPGGLNEPCTELDCAEGLTCSGEVAGPGAFCVRCEPPTCFSFAPRVGRDEGEPCDECLHGLLCREEICVRPPIVDVDEPCSETVHCRDSLTRNVCDPTADPPVCAGPAGIGESCSYRRCEASFCDRFDDEICEPYVVEDGVCARPGEEDFTAVCEPGLSCGADDTCTAAGPPDDGTPIACEG